MYNDYMQYLNSASPVGTSHKSTEGQRVFDGNLENLGDFTKTSRKHINYHLTNGTEISPIVNSIVTGVYGKTANLQARTSDSNINTQFEALIKEHGRKENFDVRKEWHRDERFREIVRFEALNGGVIIRYHHHQVGFNIPLQVELIPISKVDTSQHNVSKRLIHGVQRNKYGQMTHIWLYTDSYNMKSEKFSMKDMEFYYMPWITINQTLAVSRLVTVLESLDDISEYTTAEVKSAIEKAKTGVFWHSSIYEIIMLALTEKIKNKGDSADTKMKEAKELLDELGAKGVGVKGTTPIGKEDKITTMPNNADTVYSELMTQTQLNNASSVGTSKAAAYKNPKDTNYAGLQAVRGFDEADHKVGFDNLSNKIIDGYLRRLFKVGVETGRISLSSQKFFTNMEEWYKWDILRTSRISLDEVKDANAAQKRINADISTESEEVANRGGDWLDMKQKHEKVKIKQIEDARTMYEKAGLPIPEEYMTQKEKDAQGIPNEEK